MPSGNPIATLYTDHQPWLVNWLRKRTGCSQQAADFAQDTFLRVLLAERRAPVAASLDEPRHFLVTIAKRVMVDSFRRRSVEQAYLEVLADQPEDFVLSAEDRLSMLQTLQALDRMLDGLGIKAKAAFLMSQLQGLTYPQIAERLQVSVSSVTKYMARATEHCLLFAVDNPV
ncbi:sigma-70 family RNA polymerase sigma factor [Pseudomonas sp. LRF_L74]|uniref:sigma-70 family RNA polymerase sigma factor n=1 Tax=Pseudomonas sp. LRF_L74 TaxID=3369422 RepID=UPI003F600D0D